MMGWLRRKLHRPRKIYPREIHDQGRVVGLVWDDLPGNPAIPENLPNDWPERPYDWAEEGEDEDMAETTDETSDPTVARTISIDYTLPPMEDPDTGLPVARDFELVEELIFNATVVIVEALGGQVEGAGCGPTSDEVRGLEEEG